MTVQKSINLAIASFIAIVAAALLLVTFSVSAQEGDVQEVTPVTTQEESTEEPAEESSEDAGTFDYVAQSGDSYSLIARKAVQTYGVINSVNLSGAQIIFVETNLTLAAESPALNLGDKVSIDGNLLAEWVEKAKELTEAQQAAWQVYADRANFNTDAVGEARE
jgi:LysM repeat protein